MSVFSITYDLNKPGQNYQELYAAIKSYGNWCHMMDSYWIIDSNQAVGAIRDYLKAYIDSSDNLFVLRLTQNWASWNLSKAQTDWLQDPNRTW